MKETYNDSYERGDNFMLDDEYDPFPGTWDDEEDLLDSFDNSEVDSILDEIDTGSLYLGDD